jgi:hypothetical protein
MLDLFERKPYDRPSDDELRSVDAALALVGGHFGAAAKLLDIRVQHLRNIVNQRPWLKVKYAKGRGHPGRARLGFRINEWGGMDISALKTTIRGLSPQELSDLKGWFDAEMPEVEPTPVLAPAPKPLPILPSDGDDPLCCARCGCRKLVPESKVRRNPGRPRKTPEPIGWPPR